MKLGVPHEEHQYCQDLESSPTSFFYWLLGKKAIFAAVVKKQQKLRFTPKFVGLTPGH
jgi:hypothetical protein